MYITEKPISLKQLKNIDNLKNYLIGIENEIQNKYNANILIDRIIKKNRQYFISKLRKKKVLCIVNGKLGYTNIVNNEIIFKNISKQTLNKFIDKFYIHVILE